MRKAAALFMLVYLAGCSGRDAVRPRFVKAGQIVPELRLPKLINAPLTEIKTWEDLRGKAVVLEFWATWCEDCADSAARFNELAEKFSSEPVVFISITDETERDVKEFLRAHPIKGWVAPEAGAALFRAFRVYGRPHTVLVTKGGKVAEITNPGALAEDNIRRLLSGRLPAAGATGRAGFEAEELVEFYLAEAPAPGGSVTCGPNRLRAYGVRLKYALDFIFGATDKLEVKPEAVRAMDGVYDMRLAFPEGRGDGLKRDFFLKGLETALGLTVKDVSRATEVYVLKTAPGGPINVKKKEVSGGAKFEGELYVVEGGSFAPLCAALATRLGELVLDETRVDGNYSYSFDFKEGNKKAISSQLSSQLGLRLERKPRKIRVLEVSRPAP